MTELLAQAQAEARTAPSPQDDEAARIGWLARRKALAESMADNEALRESARRGRPVYWRSRTVTLPAEYANPLTGDRSYTVRLKHGRKADAEAGDRYSGAQLFALAGKAASIAAGKARKRAGFSLGEAEREAVAAEVALAALDAEPRGMKRRGTDGDDLAYLTATAEHIITHGGSDTGNGKARSQWRDSTADLPWGTAVGDADSGDTLTLADVVSTADVSLDAEQVAAEQDSYLADARQAHAVGGESYPCPLDAKQQAAVLLAARGTAERRAIAAALVPDCPSADWLRHERKQPSRSARKDWRKSRDRGRAALAKRYALADADSLAVLDDPPGEDRPSQGMRGQGISSTAAARALATARRADSPSPSWLAREQWLRSAVVTPSGPALRKRAGRKARRVGTFPSPAPHTHYSMSTAEHRALVARRIAQRRGQR